MAKWDVALSDGRHVLVFAPHEDAAKQQANHAETTRVVIATKRNQPITVNVSTALSAVKLKE